MATIRRVPYVDLTTTVPDAGGRPEGHAVITSEAKLLVLLGGQYLPAPNAVEVQLRMAGLLNTGTDMGRPGFLLSRPVVISQGYARLRVASADAPVAGNITATPPFGSTSTIAFSIAPTQTRANIFVNGEPLRLPAASYLSFDLTQAGNNSNRGEDLIITLAAQAV